jgi:hypothetical protein
MRQHVVCQQILAPGETRLTRVDLPRGGYRVVGARAGSVWELNASDAGYASRAEIDVEEMSTTGRPLVVRAGAVDLQLTNRTSIEQVVRLELAGRRDDAVTACIALSHPSFQEFCSGEGLRAGEHLSVSLMPFAFIEIDGQRLVDTHGDSGGYGLLHRMEEIVDQKVRENEGVVVHTALGFSLASFGSSARAAQASRSVLAAFAEERLDQCARIALHEGRCVATTRAGRMTYFGDTLLAGTAFVGDAPLGGIVASDAVTLDRASLTVLFDAFADSEVTVSKNPRYRGRRIMRFTPAVPAERSQ